MANVKVPADVRALIVQRLAAALAAAYVKSQSVQTTSPSAAETHPGSTNIQLEKQPDAT